MKKIITTRFAATLLQSLYPVSIPVTASVYPFLHSSKRYVLPNLPCIEIEIPCSGVDTGAALHWWARIELLIHIMKSDNKSACVLAFYEQHHLSFNDYDYEAAIRNNTRNVKKTVQTQHFDPKRVVASHPRNTPTLAQKLIRANTQIKAYCAANGHNAHPMFVSVLALRFNSKLSISQIAHQLELHRCTVHLHLRNLHNLPFAIPSHVLVVD